MRLDTGVACLGISLVLGLTVSVGQGLEPSPAQLALGDSVFRGRVGGALCAVCHGANGKGVTGLGPNLTDKEWLNVDGSIASIEKVVTDGVPKPRKVAAPMPPKGGGQLNDVHIKAVATYVYSLSQPPKR